MLYFAQYAGKDEEPTATRPQEIEASSFDHAAEKAFGKGVVQDPSRGSIVSVEKIAVRHRITPRYVHKLFEKEGVTFSSFVLDRRLSRAHRMLSDPERAELNISTVAFAVGFGDLSYFNRAFRRRYGITPSEVRQSVMATRNGDSHPIQGDVIPGPARQ